MKWAVMLLVTILLTFLNVQLAARFQEYKFAKCGQRVKATIGTFSMCLIFTISIPKHENVIYTLPIALALHAIMLIDWVAHRIPNIITLWLAILQTLIILVKAIVDRSFAPLFVIFYAITFFALFIVMNVFSRDQIGMGDVKLSYSLALGIGSISVLLIPRAFIFTFLFSGIFALCMLLIKKISLEASFAFGPFMLFGFWISVLTYSF